MSFRGLIAPIPLGLRGLYGSRNPSTIPFDGAIRATNVAFDRGTVQKEGGATKYNSSAISGAPSVIGGVDWHPTIGAQRMVVMTSAGDLLKDSGAGTFPVTLR